jgi:hypothetical protein
MKWMNNWEYVLGVNLFNNHGYHYTIEGERKRDWPPSQFYHHTWWKYYDRFTDYNARLSHLLSGGRHVARVLMLYPINSIWTNYTPQKRTDTGNVIEADFQYLTDALLRLHYDFDYVDEDVLADATVDGDRIVIGDESFPIVVLPPITHIKKSTLRKLEKFVGNGGKLIADTLIPIGLLEAGDDDGYEELSDFFGYDPDIVNGDFHSGSRDGIELLKPTNERPVYLFTGAGLHSTRDDETLRAVLNECGPPDIEISDEHVFYLHRVKDDFDIYFITNTSQEDLGRVSISFDRAGRPELWNPNDGSIRPIHVYSVRGGRTHIELDFPASGSHFVVFDHAASDGVHVQETNLQIVEVDDHRVVGFMNGLGDASAFAEVTNGRLTGRAEAPTRPSLPPIELPDTFEFRAHQHNVLTIGSWRMTIEEPGSDSSAFTASDFDDSGWLEVTNGAWEMQLPTERDEQTYPVTLWYRTSFEITDMPDRLSLMIDGFSGSDHELWINGSLMNGKGRRSWLDAEIRTVDITDEVGVGTNVVALRLVVNRRTDGVLDLLKIEGDFGLAEDGDGTHRIVEAPKALDVGDWTAQGYPFYSGTGVYMGSVDVPQKYLDGGRIFLEADCGEDVLEVVINGGPPLVAPWHPYRLEVTELLAPGTNAFEIKVTNTLINILEGIKHKSGLLGTPRLVHEHRYELELEKP